MRPRSTAARPLTPLALAAAVALAAGLVLVAQPTPAHAAGTVVTDAAGVKNAFLSATASGTEISLANDITVAEGLVLASGMRLTIDLEGHQLEIAPLAGTTDGSGNGLAGNVALINNGDLVIVDGQVYIRGSGGGPGAPGAAGADGIAAPALGVNGGDGADGGNGGNGGTGLVNNGTFVSTASAWGYGGDGGDGGNGGAGGDGGDGTGLGGIGGNGGNGGNGGSGGNGGDAVANTGTMTMIMLATFRGGSGASGNGGAGGAGGAGAVADGVAGTSGTDGLNGTAGGFVTGTNTSVVALDGNATDATPGYLESYAASVGDALTSLALLPGGSPARTGFTFAGWNTAADGSGSTVDTTSALAPPVTVFAQWQAIPPAPDDTKPVTPALADSGSDFGAAPWLALTALLAGLTLILGRRRWAPTTRNLDGTAR